MASRARWGLAPRGSSSTSPRNPGTRARGTSPRPGSIAKSCVLGSTCSTAFVKNWRPSTQVGEFSVSLGCKYKSQLPSFDRGPRISSAPNSTRAEPNSKTMRPKATRKSVQRPQRQVPIAAGPQPPSSSWGTRASTTAPSARGGNVVAACARFTATAATAKDRGEPGTVMVAARAQRRGEAEGCRAASGTASSDTSRPVEANGPTSQVPARPRGQAPRPTSGHAICFKSARDPSSLAGWHSSRFTRPPTRVVAPSH
mmetsp:Transcript_95377/g.218470  ORF Transcript_95377/g.218470 Transcript_95377/m.218470 type:complete len:256 (+) Transcript_95377:205-972(+)